MIAESPCINFTEIYIYKIITVTTSGVEQRDLPLNIQQKIVFLDYQHLTILKYLSRNQFTSKYIPTIYLSEINIRSSAPPNN